MAAAIAHAQVLVWFPDISQRPQTSTSGRIRLLAEQIQDSNLFLLEIQATRMRDVNDQAELLYCFSEYALWHLALTGGKNGSELGISVELYQIHRV
jgi:hypothetical protein